MDTPSPTRSGAALIGFLVGIVLVLSGFALGIIADRAVFGGATRSASGNTTAAAVVIPTVPPVPTDTVAPGRPTSTPRPAATPVPTITPQPSDPAINLNAAQNTTPDQLRAGWIFLEGIRSAREGLLLSPAQRAKPCLWGAQGIIQRGR